MTDVFEILTLKGIRRWGLWEVIKSGGQSSHEWDLCSLKKGPRNLLSPFSHVRLKQGDKHLEADSR